SAGLRDAKTPFLRNSLTPFARLRLNRQNLEGDINACWQIQFLELIDGLGHGFDDVQQPLVRALLEGFVKFLVRVRRTADGEPLDSGRQWNRAGHARAGALDRLHDFMSRLVNDPVVVSLQSNANALSSHTKNK